MQVNGESIALVLIASLLLICSASGAAQVASYTLPVCFIENNGQIDEQVLYFADTADYSVYLTKQGNVISTAEPLTAVQITYLGSDPLAELEGEGILPGKANYLIGDDESSWITGVPLFASVRYKHLYPGTDLVFHGGVNSLKSEYVLSPGADPSLIRMRYSGQEKLSLDAAGNLLVTTSAGTFTETEPYAYQVIDGREVPVSCEFVTMNTGILSFSTGAYERDLPLVIDPSYNFSTYLGGSRDDRGSGIGMDDAGNVYVVGTTHSTDFPLANSPAYQERLNGSSDIFASKFSPDGTILYYSTYIGGNNTDVAASMVVHNISGEVTFTGFTESDNYPLTPAFVVPRGGNSDAIVTRLNSDGSDLVWSRLINGNKSDTGMGIAMNEISGELVVVGYTNSDNFPTWPVVNLFLGATDGFVAEFANDGNVILFSYLGGTNYDWANAVALVQNTSGNIWVTGETRSLNFPTSSGAFRNTNHGGSDAFITELFWSNLTINASTYLGGSGTDGATGIALDPNNYPYVTGFTSSPISPINLFPVTPNPNGYQTSFGGGQWDAFITKMAQDLSRLNYSTYLGGNDDDKAYGIAVDANRTAYVTGWTMSTNFPKKYPTQPTKGEGFRVPDAFVTQMNQTGNGLLFSTFLGGTYYDEGDAIAITADGLNITVTGYTESINFPTLNPYQPALAGFPAVRFTDAFVTKYIRIPPIANFTGEPIEGCSPLRVNFTDTSLYNPTSWLWEFGDGNTSPDQNPNHTYFNTNVNAAKNFTVNLTVCNIDGCNNTSKVNYTRVCPQPFADFTADNRTGCLNLGNNTIQFNVTTYRGGVRTGPALAWNWSFGDDTYALVNFTNRNVTHTYNKTGNFTVSLTYENTCCNNTTTKEGFIDIRTKPVADFYAIPTGGLVPLDVQFYDNSTERPSDWFWTFGAGQGNSTEQNPEHTYETPGAYTVRLKACNFCDCDWENKTQYIRAGIPNLTFSPDTLVVPTNDTTEIELFLEKAEDGLSGYDLKVFWADSVHGNINEVEFPSWALNTSQSSLPNYFVDIKAVDLLNQVNPGAEDIELVELYLEGNITTFSSTITLNVSVNELDDDLGNPIVTNNVPATITVVRLLPFPGETSPPTDPFEDQVYWDLNGNERIDFNDVILFFQNMQWIRDNQYVPFFDYNSNGLIDFDDLIELFQMVPYP